MLETRDLAGTVVAVTGATSGIGWASVEQLLAAGARVVATGRRTDRLADLVTRFGDDALLTIAGDVRTAASAHELVDAAIGRWGRLDSIVLSAGAGVYGSILEGSDDDIIDLVDTNLMSTFWGIRAAVPAMLKDGGDIIVVASVAGLRGGGHEPAYAATKFGQVGLAGAVDRELREKGVRVTAICPAAVATEFAVGHGRTADMPEREGWMQPDDVAGAIVYCLRQPRRLRTTQWSLWSAAEGS